MLKIIRLEIDSTEFRDMFLDYWAVCDKNADIRIEFGPDGQFVRPENARVIVEFKEDAS